jgi:hypothetical protein
MPKLSATPRVVRRFRRNAKGVPCEGRYEYNIENTGWIDEKTYREWKSSLVREMWLEDELEHMGIVQAVTEAEDIKAFLEAEAEDRSEKESVRAEEGKAGNETHPG